MELLPVLRTGGEVEMIDKKLVINGLECAKRLIRIGPGTGSRKCRAMDACDNAIALLKEQEAKSTPTAGTNEIPLKW